MKHVRLNGRLLVAVLLVAATTASLAGSAVAIPTGIERNTMESRPAALNPFAFQTNNSTVRHEDPAAIDSGADTEALEGWIADRRRVQVVGEFAAAGIYDDQLIVPLETAYHLTNKPGVVQFIRTSDATPTGNWTTNDSVTVTSLSVESPITAGERVSVRTRVRNFADERRTRRLVLSAGNETRERTVTLPPGKSKQLTVRFEFESPGNRTIEVGSHAGSIAVLPRNALDLPAVPDSGPPGEPLAVAVRTVDDRPVANATVRVGNRTAWTGERGVARIELPAASGEYELTATKGDRSRATERIRVAEGVRKTVRRRHRGAAPVDERTRASDCERAARKPLDRTAYARGHRRFADANGRDDRHARTRRGVFCRGKRNRERLV